MRTLKFLERVKEKRNKRIEIEKELEKVEKGGKKRASSKMDFFNSNVFSKLKSNKDS
jgi:hypothetical protein